MQRHDYAGAGDLRDMQALVQRLWSPHSRWHVGDLAWARHAIPGAEERSLWLVGTEVVAWGWAEPPGHLDFVVDPAHADAAADVLTWFDDVAGPATHTSTVLETEAHLIDALETAGYVAQDDGPYFTHHLLALDDLPDVSLPAGFVVRHVEPGQAEPRAAVHRDGWSDFGSRVSTESYGNVMATWPYRPELDWVVEAADGSWVASALGWLDEVNRVGLFGAGRMCARLPETGPGAGSQRGDAVRPARGRRDDGRSRATRGRGVSSSCPALSRYRLPAGAKDGDVSPVGVGGFLR